MIETSETDVANDLQCELAAWELLSEARRERDETREDLEEETKFHHRTHTELIRNQCKSLDMEMQRDEAREETVQLLESSNRLISLLREQLTEARDIAEKLSERGLEMMDENLSLERDEVRELHRKALSEREATEREADSMLERSLKAERERDEAQKELEKYRSIAENIGAVKAVSEKEKAICERNEALNKMADALQEVDLRTLDYERMKQERDEALESRALRQILCDSQDEVLRLTFENRELTQNIDEALILGNNLADECERILGLGLHQNTIERFKTALEAWKDYNNE